MSSILPAVDHPFDFIFSSLADLKSALLDAHNNRLYIAENKSERLHE